MKHVGKSATINEITFKINDVVKDGHEQISIEYVIKSEKAINLIVSDNYSELQENLNEMPSTLAIMGVKLTLKEGN